MGRRRRDRKPQPIGWSLMMTGLTGFGVLAQGLIGMTTSRRWQTGWLIAAILAAMWLNWLAMQDPGVLSKKFF